MLEPQMDRWTTLVQQRAASLGQTLSTDVVDELACHVADVYAAVRNAGATETDAFQAASTALANASFSELTDRRRARALPSQLDARTPEDEPPSTLSTQIPVTSAR